MDSKSVATDADQDKPRETKKPGKPRRFRFRLRTLLILVTLIAVGFGGYQAIVVPYLEQAKIRQAILDAGFACDSRPAPAWLTFFVGEDAACTVTGVDLRYVRETTPYGLTHPRALIPESQFVIDGYMESKNLLLNEIPDLYADEDLLRQVGRLPDLESLNAGGQNITDDIVASWENLTNLKSLNLAETLIENPSRWPDFPLTTLDVSDTMLRDEQIAQLAKYDLLEELNLSLTPVSDDGLRQLRSLQSLRQLLLIDTAVTDASCDVLNAFSELDLLEVGIAFDWDDGKPYDNLHSLIEVTGGRSTGDGVTCVTDSTAIQKVRSEFPGRAEAFVDETGYWSFKVEPLEAFHLELIAGCDNFDSLAFYSYVPDERLAYLPTFPNLTRLTFYTTPVPARFLEHAARCPALEELSLFDTPVTDDQLAALAETET